MARMEWTEYNGSEVSINAGDGNNSISNGRFEGHMLNFKVDGIIAGPSFFIDEITTLRLKQAKTMTRLTISAALTIFSFCQEKYFHS